ncbi:MAG TPA: hypothetical protein VGM90_00465 [Kofleriaceae bacterium]
MSRGSLFVACIALALASCVPKGGGATGGGGDHPKYMMVTEKPDGVPLRVVNHTNVTITALELAGFPVNATVSPHDVVQVNIPPNGQTDLKIDPATMKDGELMLTVKNLRPGATHDYDTDILVMNDRNYDLKQPLQVDVVEDENASPPVSAGYMQDIRLTYAKAQAKAQQQANAAAEEAAKVCQKTLDAAHGKPSPGKLKAQGKFKCVFGGAFDGTMNVQLVQLAGGKITATLTEFGGGGVANNTWDGVVVGDEVRFAWNGLPSGGSGKLDPGGHAIIGTGVTLQNGACVNWRITCTR